MMTREDIDNMWNSMPIHNSAINDYYFRLGLCIQDMIISSLLKCEDEEKDSIDKSGE